jgi:hypothetical protein
MTDVIELKLRIFWQEECLKSFEASGDVRMTVRWDLSGCEISAWRKTSCRFRCVLEHRLFARKTVLEMCLSAFDTTRIRPFLLRAGLH